MKSPDFNSKTISRTLVAALGLLLTASVGHAESYAYAGDT